MMLLEVDLYGMGGDGTGYHSGGKIDLVGKQL